LINNGLLMRSVNALAISSDGMHLYAATEGGGVYRLDINGKPPEISSLSIPSQLSQTPMNTQNAPIQTKDSIKSTQAQSAAMPTKTTNYNLIGILALLTVLLAVMISLKRFHNE
jgi:hypothetical protein